VTKRHANREIENEMANAEGGGARPMARREAAAVMALMKTRENKMKH